jgi:hypothetical protein
MHSLSFPEAAKFWSNIGLKRFSVVAVASAFLWQSACGGGTLKRPDSSSPPSANISISPTSATVGSPDLTLSVTAIGALTFVGAPHNKSEVVWSANGSDTLLTTTFVSSTKLTAVIPAELLAAPFTAKVLVETGDPMGSEPLAKSGSAIFSVTTPSSGYVQPLISWISPTSAAAGSSDVTLTISGSGFACSRCSSSAVWSVSDNQTFLTTTSGSDSELIVVIPAALLTTPVSAEISVQRSHFADSFPTVSNSVAFKVTSP